MFYRRRKAVNSIANGIGISVVVQADPHKAADRKRERPAEVFKEHQSPARFKRRKSHEVHNAR